MIALNPIRFRNLKEVTRIQPLITVLLEALATRLSRVSRLQTDVQLRMVNLHLAEICLWLSCLGEDITLRTRLSSVKRLYRRMSIHRSTSRNLNSKSGIQSGVRKSSPERSPM